MTTMAQTLSRFTLRPYPVFLPHPFRVHCHFLLHRNVSHYSSVRLLCNPRKLSSCLLTNQHLRNVTDDSASPLSGLDNVLRDYLSGGKKATEVAHLLWRHVVQKGDTVVDATCGNGNDTLAMAKMVKDEFGKGCVYGMDIQEDAIKNTLFMLDMSLNQIERKSVKLFSICHSSMAEVLPKDSPIRLVAFNLGYLPGGDKTIIMKSDTTRLALETARDLLVPGGLISVVAYVGHPGGREEYDTVKAFASELAAENWVCSRIEMLNRPLAPVLVFLFKRR